MSIERLVDQEDLSTIEGVVGPGVEKAPYRLLPVEECEACQDELAMVMLEESRTLDYCRACYKCCPCARCDEGRGLWTLFVCPDCGCRVWWTSCAPTTCLCVSGCGCFLCCRSADAFKFPPGEERADRLEIAATKLKASAIAAGMEQEG